MRSQVLHRAAQVHLLSLHFTTNHVNAGAHPASVAHVPSLHMGQKSTQNNTKQKTTYTNSDTHTHTHARHRLHVGSVEEGTDLLQGEVLELQ